MPERPSHIPQENPFRTRGIAPATGKPVAPEESGKFVEKYLGQSAGREMRHLLEEESFVTEQGTTLFDNVQPQELPETTKEQLRDVAEDLLEQVEEQISKDPKHRFDYGDVSVARAYATLGDYEAAKKKFEGVEEWRQEHLADLSIMFALRREYDKAIELAQTSEERPDMLLSYVSEALAEEGSIERAAQVADMMGDSSHKVDVYATVARNVHKTKGDYQEYVNKARKVAKADNTTESYLGLAKLEQDLGLSAASTLTNIDKQKLTLSLRPETESRSEQIKALARLEAADGQIENAIKTLQAIDDHVAYARTASMMVIQEQQRGGDPQKILQALRTRAGKEDHRDKRDLLLAEAAFAQAKTGIDFGLELPPREDVLKGFSINTELYYSFARATHAEGGNASALLEKAAYLAAYNSGEQKFTDEIIAASLEYGEQVPTRVVGEVLGGHVNRIYENLTKGRDDGHLPHALILATELGIQPEEKWEHSLETLMNRPTEIDPFYIKDVALSYAVLGQVDKARQILEKRVKPRGEWIYRIGSALLARIGASKAEGLRMYGVLETKI